jgi:hypothetical protein
MSNALEALKQLGFETLPEGLTAEKVKETLSTSDEFAGVFSAVNRLKEERDGLKTQVSGFEQEKAELAAKAEEALRKQLESEGKFEELRKLDQQKFEQDKLELLKKGETYLEKLKEQSSATMRTKLAGLIDSKHGDIADLLVRDLVVTDVVDGNVVSSIKIGENTFTDFEQAKAHMATLPTYASRMAGAQTQGAPAFGGKNIATQETNTKAELAKSKGDLNGYLAANINLNQ